MKNNFTDKEAIDRLIALRDKLQSDCVITLEERYQDQQAIGYVINLIKTYKERYGEM